MKPMSQMNQHAHWAAQVLHKHRPGLLPSEVTLALLTQRFDFIPGGALYCLWRRMPPTTPLSFCAFPLHRKMPPMGHQSCCPELLLFPCLGVTSPLLWIYGANSPTLHAPMNLLPCRTSERPIPSLQEPHSPPYRQLFTSHLCVSKHNSACAAASLPEK